MFEVRQFLNEFFWFSLFVAVKSCQQPQKFLSLVDLIVMCCRFFQTILRTFCGSLIESPCLAQITLSSSNSSLLKKQRKTEKKLEPIRDNSTRWPVLHPCDCGHHSASAQGEYNQSLTGHTEPSVHSILRSFCASFTILFFSARSWIKLAISTCKFCLVLSASTASYKPSAPDYNRRMKPWRGSGDFDHVDVSKASGDGGAYRTVSFKTPSANFGAFTGTPSHTVSNSIPEVPATGEAPEGFSDL